MKALFHMLSKGLSCVNHVCTVFLSLALILIRIGNIHNKTLSIVNINIITWLNYAVYVFAEYSMWFGVKLVNVRSLCNPRVSRYH